PSLTESLMRGMTDFGVDVVDLGQISTEIHYYVSGVYGYDANVIVSASHNPGEYNGLKAVVQGVVPLHGGYGFPEIKELLMQEVEPVSKKGTVTQLDVLQEFVEYVLKKVNPEGAKGMKVVVDCGNGMGGPVWQEIAGKVPFEISPLYFEPDGRFPNHLADPIKDENVQDLIAAVREQGADIGIAVDGDADRVFFVDENGTKFSGTVTTAIFADYLLRKGKSGSYFYNANIGRIVPETVEKYGSTAIRTKVGHSGIKQLMREHNGIFAGEHSGHFYFDDNFNAESSLYEGLLMMQILAEYGKKASEIRQSFDVYPQSGEKNFKVQDAEEVLIALRKAFQPHAVSVDELDGLSFWFTDWWFIVRKSKTEPLLRLNVEADNEKILQERMGEVIGIIEWHISE
ncbi:MAG: phosphomannomutase/phosphoglucomutase, partial [Candidatus Dojkabacteria bacterium]